MYDLSLDFKKFYYNEVVLSKEETNKLREKKKLNIQRLKDGLDEYNTENNTNYKIAETLEQGSVAMSTVTQNQKNDYDIDVAIVFDDTNLNGLGHRAVKNVVVDALKRKCTNFKTPPEALSNCVRIVYSDNYHIDFAIYKRIKNDDGGYKYEHAGAEKWNSRNPRAINNWFKDEIKIHGEKLRQAVRLSKMFCKSRSDWKMPGGLIQSVLCDEKIPDYERMDEMFYYTMKEIEKRLEDDIEVYNPTDSEQSLLLKESDRDKMNNWANRLKDKLNKLDILFDDGCTLKDAIEAWNEFFKHEFWTYDEENKKRACSLSETFSLMKSSNIFLDEYDDTEEFIQNIMPIEDKYFVKLDCKVADFETKNGDIQIKQIIKLSTLRNAGKKIPLNRILGFYLDINKVPYPFEIYWKVKNNGKKAIENNCIRGEIFKNKEEPFDRLIEESSFEGDHYVECYIVKNGVCVAKDRIEVPISKL
ncbi:nucleotide-binding domain-containing protein [Tissierella praeacuta]|uniref:nucleotide-binding domain-containing protein n=1 Tax=Tissierella praeacuta TaxID=43131 RepID=UPI001C10CD68|nr:nucleotidyltransferase [Tissierella praeacuta]MBU5257220.1 nucleotidyltransferase [Tissierella praeacuta]